MPQSSSLVNRTHQKNQSPSLLSTPGSMYLINMMARIYNLWMLSATILDAYVIIETPLCGFISSYLSLFNCTVVNVFS